MSDPMTATDTENTLRSEVNENMVRARAKGVLSLSSRINTESLATICIALAGASSKSGSSPFEINDNRENLNEECRRFLRSLRRGCDYHLDKYVMVAKYLPELINPLPRLVVRAAAALLLDPITRLVAGVLPDTCMWPGRVGTWNMLSAIERTADIEGWHHCATLQIPDVSGTMLLADVLSDFAEYVADCDDLRWVEQCLAESGTPKAHRILSLAHPLASPVIELRLHHILRRTMPDIEHPPAILFRQSDRLVVMGQSVRAVMEVMNRVKEALHDAGLVTTEAGYCIDLSEGSVGYSGFALDRLSGQTRIRLDKSAFTNLQSRLLKCHESNHLAIATERTLTEWAYEFAPGLIDRNICSDDWVRADGIRENILKAINDARIDWPNSVEFIDHLCSAVACLWSRFKSAEQRPNQVSESGEVT